MMPHEWKENYGSIRGSVQYIMIKIKMTSKFDDRIDAVEQTFYELLKWPQIDELND